jgi:hypothetical protein
VEIEMAKETVVQIKERIADRFDVLEILTQECLNGNTRSLIVSGPPGLGKSYTVEKKLKQWDPSNTNYSVIKGYVRATGLFKTLYEYRNPGQVIVFDDADAIFFDDTALNLLKSVCDTTEKRVVSWLSQTKFKDENDDVIPSTFSFEGSIIFITNLDFDALIDKSHKLAPHLKALISRSHYIDLALKTKQDFIVRIQQVIEQGLLNELNTQEKSDVIGFITDNYSKLRELSLRMAIKIGNIRKSSKNWVKIVNVTCCRN